MTDEYSGEPEPLGIEDPSAERGATAGKGIVFDPVSAAYAHEHGYIYLGEDICVAQNIPPYKEIPVTD
jgi:hypothetical protein